MRKRFIATAIVFGLNLVPQLVLAQAGAPTRKATDRLQGVGSQAGFGQDRSLPLTIGQIIQSVLALLGIMCMAYLIYGGYTWLMARGDESKVEKAKETIKDAIIGVLIILSAYIISAFVLSRFGAATGYRG
jgi:cytochrome bd-type quinol oxidase subunit 2